MPTLSSAVIPPPMSWDEFEEISLSAVKIKWDSPTFTRHGRSGQAQSGVDLYGPDELGALVGVQCKLNSDEIAGNLEGLVQDAEVFDPPLHEFFFATASPTDVKLQQEVRLLSQSRVKQQLFPVGIFFWQDIIQELIKSREELCKHYPQFCDAPRGTESEQIRMLALLTLGYYGMSLNFYIELIFGEFGIMAQEDPRQFTVVTRTVAACARAALGPSDAELIQRHLAVLENQVFQAAESMESESNPWRVPENLAVEIEGYVQNVEYTLDALPVWAFRLGTLLARWNDISFHADPDEEALPDNLREKLFIALKALFGEEDVPQDISEELARFDQKQIGSSSAPGRVHALTREHLSYPASA